LKPTKKEQQIMPTMKPIVDRIETFRAAWREMAPGASFAGMTLAEFEVAIAAPLGLRDEITDLELKLVGKKAERSISDGAAGEMLSLVVNSVRGTPGFGRDCPLYRAFGYVRKSERKSGLTRKARVTTKGADAA
jgi:hypothetical protein